MEGGLPGCGAQQPLREQLLAIKETGYGSDPARLSFVARFAIGPLKSPVSDWRDGNLIGVKARKCPVAVSERRVLDGLSPAGVVICLRELPLERRGGAQVGACR